MKQAGTRNRSKPAPLQRAQLAWVRGETADAMGPVFLWEGEYYRAVWPRAEKRATMLFDEGLVDKLQEIGFLNPQRRSALEVEGAAFTIVSEPATFAILPNYYPYVLLRRAALKWLDASILLAERGLCLIDGHCGNFALFNNCDPRWFDLGSIVWVPPEPNLNYGIKEFLRFFLSPLLATAKHPALHDVIRSHAMRLDRGLVGPEAEYLTGFRLQDYGTDRRRVLLALKDAVERLDFGWPKTTWSHYAVQRVNRVSAASLEDARPGSREGAVLSLLREELDIDDTVLDLGGNDGYFGLHAAAFGAQAIISDSDEEALERGLTRVDAEPTWKVAFVSGDAMENVHHADIVLALALTHHLRLSQERYFENIARTFASFTRRTLITEFMPWGLSTDKAQPDLPADYTLENFVAKMNEHFASVEVVAHNVAEAGHPRVLLLCRK